MKRILSILLSSIFILSSFISCQRNSAQIKSLQRLEEGVSNPTTIQELEDAISKYQSRIDDLVTAEAQVGIWYKILGTRYLDKRMYGKALECFQKAAGYYPDNANLFYYIGVCARQMGIASIGVNNTATATQKDYFRMSEKAYLTALDKDPKYYRAMYAIGILYTFQLLEHEKAIPHLEKFVSVQTRDVDGMFALARVYYCTEQYQKAVDLYDKIISLNPGAVKLKEAQDNKEFVINKIYE